MKVKLQDCLFTPGAHIVNGITLKVSADKNVKAYLDGELFLFTPGGMSIATRETNSSKVKLKNALNKFFQVIDFPMVWSVKDGTLCFTPGSQAFTNNQELTPGTTYAHYMSCVFHWWQMETKQMNDFMYQELRSERYL